MPKYEIITTSISETNEVLKTQANRIELIRNFDEGGLTPNLSVIKQHEGLNIEVNVMLRPHSKSFIYSADEFNEIVDTLHQICKLDIDGIVFGSITEENKINIEQAKVIRQITNEYNKNFTFHRAFDELTDYESAVNQLNEIGIDTLLTSGTKQKAADAIDILLAMKEKANFTIMVGSGINTNNVYLFKKDFDYIHVGAGTRTPEEIDGNIDINKIKKILS